MKTKLLTLLVILLSQTISTASAQWKWLNPKPSGLTGKSITFVNDQTGYIVNGSQLLYTKDAGANWEVKQDVNYANEIRFKDNTGFIIGDYGNIYKSVDQGDSWQKLNANTSENLNSVHILHPDTIYITSTRSLFKTTNGGLSWSAQRIVSPVTNIPTVSKSIFINSKVWCIK